MRRRTPPLALLALLLAGCGGSSHHSSGSDVNSGTDTNARVGPQVTIAWAARARDFAAPTSAAFAVVTVPGGGANGADAAATIVRPDGTAAVSKTYTVPIAVQPGLRLLRVDFYATSPVAPGFGTVPPSLATTTINVKVLNDGTLQTLDGKALGTVGFATNVASIALATGQTIETGVTGDLGVTATTTTGGVAALTPGTVTFQVTVGTAFLKVNTDGSFTGLATGTATVVPTADGVTGLPVTVAVLPAPVTSRSVAIVASALVASPTQGVVYAALPSTAVNGNSVVSIDAATGTVGTPIPVGSNPNTLAISDDGTTLYAGLGGARAIRRVDLTTNTAGLQFSLPTDPTYNAATTALDLAVQPGHSGTLGVVSVTTFGTTGGPTVFDDGVARANVPGNNSATRLVWTDQSRIVALTNGAGILDISVDAQGASLTRTVQDGAVPSNSFVSAGGRLYDQSGNIFSATTLEPVGKFNQPSVNDVSQQFYGPVVDVAAKRAYFVEIGYSGSAYLNIYDTESCLQLASRRIPGLTLTGYFYYSVTVVSAGSGRLAVLLNDQVVFLDNVSSL